jgi:lysozyme
MPVGLVPVLAAVLAALCLAVIPFISGRQKGEKGDPVPKGFSSYCIDISHHNGTRIQWDSIYVMTDRSGKTCTSIEDAADARKPAFIFIKATEGSDFTDKHFKKNWASAEDSGIRRGAYHFFRPSSDPARQAEHFLRTVGTLSHGDLPPVLDIETLPRGCTGAMLTEAASVWLETVAAASGRRPIVYTSDSYARDILGKEITGKYPVWIAHYRVREPEFGDWKMWQFTDRAVIHGIRGRVDLSVVAQGFNP